MNARFQQDVGAHKDAPQPSSAGPTSSAPIFIFWPLWIIGSLAWWYLADYIWGGITDIFSYLLLVGVGVGIWFFASLALTIAIDMVFARRGGRRRPEMEGGSPVHGIVVEEQGQLQTDLKIATQLRRQLVGFRLAFIGVGLAIAALCFVLPALFSDLPNVQLLGGIVGTFFALADFLAAMSLHIAAPNEVAVVFFLGRFRKQGSRLYGVRGLRKTLRADKQGYEYDTGGFFWIFPLLETFTMVSLRIHRGHFKSSLTQTSDQVSVNVEVTYYARRSVEHPELSVIAVEGSDMVATHEAAQIASRDMLGKSTLAQVTSDLRAVANAAQETLRRLVVDWGHEITFMGMTDLNIVSEKVRDALSEAAEASKVAEARVTVAQAEEEVAKHLDTASATYQRNPQALLLRYMKVIEDATKEGKSTVVLPGNIEGLFGGLLKGLEYPVRVTPPGGESQGR